jgi:hypothetical protein
MIKLLGKCLLLCTLGIFILMLMSFKSEGKIRFPDEYIPMWASQTSDEISTVINVANITRITPEFSTDIMSKAEDAYHLSVRLADGEVIKVYEDLEEFLSRIRQSQK